MYNHRCLVNNLCKSVSEIQKRYFCGPVIVIQQIPGIRFCEKEEERKCRFLLFLSFFWIGKNWIYLKRNTLYG